MGRAQSGWSNAPLAYVVAMIRFGRISFSEDILDIHEALRHSFPQLEELSTEVHQMSVTPEGVTPSKINVPEWIMTSPNRKTGVLVREDAVFVHTVDYSDSASFMETFSKVINAVNKSVDIGHYLMLGLRYIDIIQQVEDKDLQGYVKPQLRQMSIAGEGEKQTTLIQMTVQSENIMLNSRCFHLDELPEFIVPVELDSLFKKLNTKDVSGRVGYPAIVLDNDCIYNPDEMKVFNEGDIRSMLENELHRRASNAFKNAITEEARIEWQ